MHDNVERDENTVMHGQIERDENTVMHGKVERDENTVMHGEVERDENTVMHGKVERDENKSNTVKSYGYFAFVSRHAKICLRDVRAVWSGSSLCAYRRTLHILCFVVCWYNLSRGENVSMYNKDPYETVDSQIFSIFHIAKTSLCKYVENFTSKSWKFSDKNLCYFSYFFSKHRL